MSVIIKGQHMPTNCDDCDFHESGYPGWCNLSVSGYGEIFNSEIVQEWCPLVEIPTPHGRLIDADNAFINVDETGFDYWHSHAELDAAQAFLNDQPTVIEAEGEEND